MTTLRSLLLLSLMSTALWLDDVNASPLTWKLINQSLDSPQQSQAPKKTGTNNWNTNPPSIKPTWMLPSGQNTTNNPIWIIVEPNKEIPPVTAVETAPHPANQQKKTPPSEKQTLSPHIATAPTFGGFRDLYRAGRWYPSISTIVPMGFGPQGVMAGIGISGSDCTIESKQCFYTPTPTLESIQKIGEAVVDSYIGLGSSDKAIGILVTQLTQDTFRSSERGSYFNGNQTGLAITRNLGPSTAIKLGAEGAIRWGGANNLEADRPKSAFGVISQRIQLKAEPTIEWSDTPTRWFTDVYLTLGAGNGQFRPLDQVISAQIQSAKDSGCWYTACSPQVTRNAFLRGTEWGEFYPIGSIALSVTDQMNLITEWTGRNLNISLSWQPLREWGWTVTPGIGNLVQNSDYGKNIYIPACPECGMGEAITTRPILYFRTMVNFRF